MKQTLLTLILAIAAQFSFAAVPDSLKKDLEDFSSEGLGIAPDVIIPLPIARKLTDNIDEWVLWVAEDLKK